MEVGNVTDAYTTEDEGMKEDNSEAAAASKEARAAPSPGEEPVEKREHAPSESEAPKKARISHQDAEESKPTFAMAESADSESSSPPQAKVCKVIPPESQPSESDARPADESKAYDKAASKQKSPEEKMNGDAEPTVSVAFTQPTTTKMVVDEEANGVDESDDDAVASPPSEDEIEQVVISSQGFHSLPQMVYFSLVIVWALINCP